MWLVVLSGVNFSVFLYSTELPVVFETSGLKTTGYLDNWQEVHPLAAA